jgi:hypothetical protein
MKVQAIRFRLQGLCDTAAQTHRNDSFGQYQLLKTNTQ